MPVIPNMHRKFIAAVLAASIAITGFSAAPARADEDVAKFIAGLVALGIIGAAINDAKKDDHHKGYQHQPKREVHKHYHTVKPKPAVKPKPHSVRRYDLPGGCLSGVKVRGEYKRFVSKHCLERNYKYTHALPGQCRVTIDNGYQRQHGFRPRCLRRHGYRLKAG